MRHVPIEQRLMAKIRIDSEGGCWMWQGTIQPAGYGMIGASRSRRRGVQAMLLAHRVAYETFVGPIPDGLCVLHKCDVRACVNPKHLFLGTKQDNAADMVAKGRKRNAPQPGETNPAAKLTREQVLEIRASSGLQKEIAKKFNITPSNVHLIKARKNWAWL